MIELLTQNKIAHSSVVCDHSCHFKRSNLFIKDYFYDVDAFEHLSAFVADCDRKTESSKVVYSPSPIFPFILAFNPCPMFFSPSTIVYMFPLMCAKKLN